MDITALTAQQATDQSNVDAATVALKSAQDALDLTTAELSQANLINALEALDEAGATTVNEALSSDPDNKTGISLSFPPATETEA